MNIVNGVFDDRRITKWLPQCDYPWCVGEVQRMAKHGVKSEVVWSLPVRGRLQRCAVVRLDGELFGVCN